MTVILAAPPDQQAALRFGVPVAHMGYRIGPGGRLARGNLPSMLRGGLLMLSDCGFTSQLGWENLCREILRECQDRHFEGVVADFETELNPQLGTLLAELFPQLEKQKLSFYVSEPYAGFCVGARVLVSTALSGGTLVQRLGEASHKYGAARIALDVQRVSMEFPLPCPGGIGAALPLFSLQKLLAEREPPVFFSPELCAYYFLLFEKEEYRLVLYDDACSILQKLHLARQFGIREAFLIFPEVQDIAREII